MKLALGSLALITIFGALAPTSIAREVCDEGSILVAIQAGAISVACGESCEGNLLVLGVALLADNTTCSECRDNVLNVGVAVVGDNDQCQAALPGVGYLEAVLG